MSYFQNTIAIVYDFDGTLSPDNMQERTIFDHYNIDKDLFWKRAQELVNEHEYERTLAYLQLLIHEPPFKDKPLSRDFLNQLGRSKIRYFNGVEEYFDRLKPFLSKFPEVEKLNICLEHYIVSSGMKEILEACALAKHFKKIYACEFDYQNGKPIFPKLVINDTNKTQFLFRINKGRLELNEDINSHMPHECRRIPFRNMIYIGDGHTDIPSMTVTQKFGGHSIAVFKPGESVPEEIKLMVTEGRADHFAPADFSEGKLLVKIIHKALQKIIQDISYRASANQSKDWAKKNA